MSSSRSRVRDRLFRAGLLSFAAAAMLFHAVEQPATAQMQEHQHNFVPGPAIEEPGPTVESSYVRIGETVALFVPSIMDFDTCTGDGGCSFPSNTASDGVHLEQWSDGGAGGEFGYLDQGQFVPTTNATQVTHYKCPLEPRIIYLTLTVDDDAFTTENAPEGSSGIALGDDPPRTSSAYACGITCYDFSFTGPGEGWRPSGGYQAQDLLINILIEPSSDHNLPPEDMGGTLQVQIASSNLPGYCGNKGYEAGSLEAGLSDFALMDQANWQILDPASRLTASTHGPKTSVDLLVKSLDYGGWGGVGIQLTSGPIAGAIPRLRTGPKTGPGMITSLNMPLDVDGDHISDLWDKDLTKDGFAGPLTDRDNDLVYANNLKRGDGFSDYEDTAASWSTEPGPISTPSSRTSSSKIRTVRASRTSTASLA